MNDKYVVINDEFEIKGEEYDQIQIGSDLLRFIISDMNKVEKLSQSLYGVKEFNVKVFNDKASNTPIITFDGESEAGFEINFMSNRNVGKMRIEGKATYNF